MCMLFVPHEWHVVRNRFSFYSGFIDVYNEDKEIMGQHGARILNVSRVVCVMLNNVTQIDLQIFVNVNLSNM